MDYIQDFKQEVKEKLFCEYYIMGCTSSAPIYCEEFTNEPTLISSNSSKSLPDSNNKYKLSIVDINVNHRYPHKQML